MDGLETVFTPGPSALGGVLIGVAAGLLLLFTGRIAGISGILGGLFVRPGDRDWRVAFLLGLVAGGVALVALSPGSFSAPLVSRPALVVAGLLVGVGTQLGSGCTSGHGICGLPRLSLRSLAAVLTFMLTGGLTVFALRVLGGSL